MVASIGHMVDNFVHLTAQFYERACLPSNVYLQNTEKVDNLGRHHKPAEIRQFTPFVYLLSFRTKEGKERRERGEAPEVFGPKVDTGAMVDRRPN